MSNRPLIYTDTALQSTTFVNNSTLDKALDRLANRFAVVTLGTLEIILADQPAESFDSAGYTISNGDDPFETRLPSDDDITRDYLLRHDWLLVDGVPYAQFVDPISGDTVDYLEACRRQDERDTSDYIAEIAAPELLRSELTIGFDYPNGESTIRPFVCPEHQDATSSQAYPAVTVAETPRPGIEYYAGRQRPHRAYCETDGIRKYLGYFKDEAEAWKEAIEEVGR